MPELERLFDQVRREQDAALGDSGRRLAVRRRLLTRSRAAQPALRVGRFAAAGALALGALVAAWLLLGDLRTGAAPLTFVVAEVAREPGEFLAAPAGASLGLSFSDGSTVTLGERSAARVERVTAEGASLLLESGTADVSVVHRSADTHWTVVSGPYAVEVVGTRFRVTWDARTERFELHMFEGRVLVSGPGGGPRAFAAGETYQASGVSEGDDARVEAAVAESVAKTTLETVSGGAVHGLEAPMRGVATGATAAAPLAPEVPVTRLTSDASATPVKPVLRTGRDGDASAVSARSAAAGSELGTSASPPESRASSRASLGVGDLKGPALDAWLGAAAASEIETAAALARRDGAPDEPRFYEALRERFPGSVAASDAAFFLARYALARSHDPRASERWLRVTLAEAPSGPWAAEATGRLLEFVAADGRTAEARRLAKGYLARFPDGPHAAYARSLAVEP